MAKAADETGATEAVEVESRALTPAGATELSVKEVGQRLDNIHTLQKEKMKAGIDYGVIPGTGSNPTLLKAGAEKLCVLFRLDAQFETQTAFAEPHMTAMTKCVIYHQVTGQRLGAATAMCSSKESKYAYRKASRLCPNCGKEAIIKSKAEYGGGWLCFKKKDGCGAKFADDDKSIIGQASGRAPNEDVADQFPTVLRMAEKRALIAAVRLVTGASAIFDEPMTDAKDSDDEDPADSFDQAHPPTHFEPNGDHGGAIPAGADDGTFSEAWRSEISRREPDDGGVKVTRIALIKKAIDTFRDKDKGLNWLTDESRTMGKTSETLTIDDMLRLSERLTKLKGALA